MQKRHPFGSTLEAVIYPTSILLLMWLVYGIDLHWNTNITKYGVLPRTLEGIKGVLFMPWIHSDTDIHHILNNSLPALFLSSTIVYFYRDIALKVLLVSWIGSGIGVWLIARNVGSYHIGMSGVIYALAAFVFVSGVLRKYRPLQSMAMFVAFLYGGMIWGVFPTEERISWEGHLSGLFVGVLLAFYFSKEGTSGTQISIRIGKRDGN